MAPKRKGGARKTSATAAKLQSEDVEKQEAPAEVEDAIAAEEDENEAEAAPSPKKAKVEEKKKRGRKPKAATKTTAAKKSADDDDLGKDGEEAADEEGQDSDNTGKVVVIEASKECNCFKTRAAKVQTGLTKAIPGIEVLINPDKPRKGCFEVRGKDGNIYMSLLGMPRPFTKLKSLDMDKAVEEIVAKVK